MYIRQGTYKNSAWFRHPVPSPPLLLPHLVTLLGLDFHLEGAPVAHLRAQQAMCIIHPVLSWLDRHT